MLINKIQQQIKSQLFSRHTFIALISCILLSVCGLLSTSALALEKSTVPDSFEQKQLASKSNGDKHINNDPTRPPSVIVQQLAQELSLAPEYQLTAIFMRNSQQYAVVNGNVVKTGDAVENMLVTHISGTNLTMKEVSSSKNRPKDTVVLELNGAVTVKTQVTK